MTETSRRAAGVPNLSTLLQLVEDARDLIGPDPDALNYGDGNRKEAADDWLSRSRTALLQTAAERPQPAPAPLVMRAGHTLSRESPVTGGLVTLYEVTPDGRPDICVGATFAATAGMIVRAVNAVAEYENAIGWQTSCLNCARLLDSGNIDRERTERAEEKLAEYENAGQVAVSREDLRALLSLVWDIANTGYMSGPVFSRLSAAAGES
jgi:hypothetical protein